MYIRQLQYRPNVNKTPLSVRIQNTNKQHHVTQTNNKTPFKITKFKNLLPVLLLPPFSGSTAEKLKYQIYTILTPKVILHLPEELIASQH